MLLTATAMRPYLCIELDIISDQKSGNLHTRSNIFSEIILICSNDDPRLILTNYMAILRFSGEHLSTNGPLVNAF